MKHVMVILCLATALLLTSAHADEATDEAEVLPTLEEIAALLPEPPQCLCAPYERYYDEDTQALLFTAKDLEDQDRYEEAFDIYLTLAEGGNAEAQVRVSRYFFLWTDYWDNWTYYRREAPEDPPGINERLLRGQTFDGRRPAFPHTPSGAEEGARWLELAAAQGHVLAMNGLATYVSESSDEFSPLHQEADPALELAYTYMAAHCNEPHGQYWLGKRLMSGYVTEVDRAEAWAWIAISARNDYERALTYRERFFNNPAAVYPSVVDREAGEAMARDWLATNPGPVCESGRQN